MDKKQLQKLALPLLLILIGFAFISLSVELFSDISENVISQEIRVFDDMMIELLLRVFTPRFNHVMIFITELGSVWFVASVSLLVALYLWFRKKDGWSILFLFITVGGGGLLNLLLKSIYQIDRPSINVQYDAVGYSFPSGHAMGSLFLYGFIVYLIIKSQLSKTKKILSSAALISLIALVAISRVYLNVHFPSYVIAGHASGLAWLLVCIIALEMVKFKTRHNFKVNKTIRRLLDKYINKK